MPAEQSEPSYLETIKLKSPIDGSVYAERPVATDAQVNKAVETARAAQPAWAALSVDARCKYMLTMLEALVGMSDEIVPELAQHDGPAGALWRRIRRREGTHAPTWSRSPNRR